MSTDIEVKTVGVAGSLRDASYTREALKTALDAAETEGADTDLVDPRNHELSPFDPDVDGGVDDIVERVDAADSVLLATPMYHGSYSSAMKAVLDHCGFDEFEDKTVGLIAVSGGGFPITALEHLRSVCRALNAWVIPHQAAVPRSDSAFDDGGFVDESLEDRVERVGRLSVRFAGVGECDSFESEQNPGGS